MPQIHKALLLALVCAAAGPSTRLALTLQPNSGFGVTIEVALPCTVLPAS